MEEAYRVSETGMSLVARPGHITGVLRAIAREDDSITIPPHPRECDLWGFRLPRGAGQADQYAWPEALAMAVRTITDRLTREYCRLARQRHDLYQRLLRLCETEKAWAHPQEAATLPPVEMAAPLVGAVEAVEAVMREYHRLHGDPPGSPALLERRIKALEEYARDIAWFTRDVALLEHLLPPEGKEVIWPAPPVRLAVPA